MSSGQSIFQEFQEACLRCENHPDLYKAAFHETSSPLLLFSLSREILDANTAMEEVSRFPRRELLAMPFDALFPKTSDYRRLLFSEGRLSASTPLFTFTTRMRQPDQGDVPVDVAIAPLPGPHRDRPFFQAHITAQTAGASGYPSLEISETLQTQDRLKSIGALAGGIAHNFNNILTGIYGNITLAKLELPPSSNVFRHLERAEGSMDEAVKLTKQLLTFAKGGDPVMVRFDPGALIGELVRFNLAGSNVRLTMDVQDGIWPIQGDRDQIAQVISAVVINAREAMPHGGELAVRMKNATFIRDNLLTIARGKYLTLRFKDNGTGIAQNDLPRIFDPYFTTKDGNGMGLSICYSIIRKHKGHIFASSQLGSGTTITIHLPAMPDIPAKENAMNTTISHSNTRARILVMDDEEHIRTITRKMIEKFGYDVTITEDGETAVAAYMKALEEGTPFGLVIMDLTIPGGMGGQEASRHILDMDPNASIVVSSGYSNDKIMSDYKAYGLKGIIPKPFRLAELKAVLEKLVP